MNSFIPTLFLLLFLVISGCCTQKACESAIIVSVIVSNSVSQLGDSVKISRKSGSKLEEEWAIVRNVTGQPRDTNLILILPKNWKMESGVTYIFEFNQRPSKLKFEITEVTFAKEKCNGTPIFGFPCDYYQVLKSYKINDKLQVGFPIRI